MDDNSKDRLTLVQRFLEPSNSTHRQYEALRAFFVDETPSAEAAALRESEEEVGLPRAAVEVLGALDDTETVATRFVITPFVGLVRGPVVLRPDGREIEKVIEVPVAPLLEPRSFRVEQW